MGLLNRSFNHYLKQGKSYDAISLDHCFAPSRRWRPLGLFEFYRINHQMEKG